MPNSSEQFSLALNWAYFEVPPGSTTSPSPFYLPVGSLSIMAKPYSQGSIGSTTVKDVNGTVHYRCDGFRHDVQIRYTELPTQGHDTFRAFVQELHDTGGEARFKPASGSSTADNRGQIDVVADFTEQAVQAKFRDRGRARPESLTLKGKNVVSQIKPWLTD